MTAHEEFLAWVHGPLTDAERALHDGDPEPRRALWSRTEPVSVLGAWRNAIGLRETDELFDFLGRSMSDCRRFEIEVLAFDVNGDAAHTVAFEHTAVSVDGVPRSYTLRVTQVYRREAGGWRVAHRHGDTAAE
ncbi:nuclear transport factor 2 family protein [Agromyces arachidis]|uniref:nuclear transport factor 2 family protein n=1 Tax=Agromyces arachidis TaxID=766966 RepID=UPI0040565FDD